MRMCACRGTAGFAHVSCLAEQAKILVAEGQENKLGAKAMNERWNRWSNCSLCEQQYHGIVSCALGCSCWKTYVGRPEENQARIMAISVLGNGLQAAKRYEDAASVQEAELSMQRRLGDSEYNLLILQGNLANSYAELKRSEQALSMRQEVYSGHLKLLGEEHYETLREASNYAVLLFRLERYKEAKSLLRETMPIARRVLDESNETTLRMRWLYAVALCQADGATLDDLREAVTTLEETTRIARRVFGGAHPFTTGVEEALRQARARLRARETQSSARA